MRVETLIYKLDDYGVPLWKDKDSIWIIDNDPLAKKLGLFGRGSSNVDEMLTLIKQAIMEGS